MLNDKLHSYCQDSNELHSQLSEWGTRFLSHRKCWGVERQQTHGSSGTRTAWTAALAPELGRHCSPHKRGHYDARSLKSEDWTSPHHTHNAPFIPLEGMNYSHPNTKQKLDSLQEKLSVCQSLHHCTVINKPWSIKRQYILFCWWIAETFHFLHEKVNRTLLPPTHYIHKDWYVVLPKLHRTGQML